MKDKFSSIAGAVIIGVAAYLAGRDVGRKSAEAELSRNRSCLEVLTDTQDQLSDVQYELQNCSDALAKREELLTDAAVYTINTSRVLKFNGMNINDYMRVPYGSTLSELIWIGENKGVAGKEGDRARVTMPEGSYFLPDWNYFGFHFPNGLDLIIDGSSYVLGSEAEREELPSGVLVVGKKE